MCGFILSINPSEENRRTFESALRTLSHRGPDDSNTWEDASGQCLLGHHRLSVIDLSIAGRQPYGDPSGRYHLVFNGEIYNFVELRMELRSRWDFRTQTDTEVLLAAYVVWGEHCLDRLNGMFSFAIWDSQTKKLFAARDRFGVKPLYYSVRPNGSLLMASEIKALHALGVSKEPDATAWRTYFTRGLYDHGPHSFFADIRAVPPGHVLRHSVSENSPEVLPWYILANRLFEQGPDPRTEEEVAEELFTLLEDAVQLRLRSDVAVGVSLSGGLDSALLLGLIREESTSEGKFQSFTFAFGDDRYDETRWTQAMLEGSGIKAHECLVRAEEIPELASRVQAFQDEPFGGLPTLGLAKVHLRAQELGVTVLLDGNGLDEGWAGYDYYLNPHETNFDSGPVQGTTHTLSLSEALDPEFAAGPTYGLPDKPFKDALLNLQHRDLASSKIPRAMRFADRVSMMASRELREPFLDYRIVELGMRQPPDRKIRNGQGKWLPRFLAEKLLPSDIALAPKRAVQTPQREWLRGSLSAWAASQIESALSGLGSEWFDKRNVHDTWLSYLNGDADNSFPVWQLINFGLLKSKS